MVYYCHQQMHWLKQRSLIDAGYYFDSDQGGDRLTYRSDLRSFKLLCPVFQKIFREFHRDQRVWSCIYLRRHPCRDRDRIPAP